jgi:protein SCO1/2
MSKKLYLGFMLSLVILVSILTMIIPTLFTKNISRITLNKEIDLPLVLDDEKEVKLVFFGYSGCTDVCTPRLNELSEFYTSLDEKMKKKVGVEFFDISTPYDTTLPQRFAKFFNKDFNGIYLNKTILREYTKAFNVFFAPSLTDKTEFEHTANLYLVQKNTDESSIAGNYKNNKTIKYIYNSYPYDFKQIKSDIEELTNE